MRRSQEFVPDLASLERERPAPGDRTVSLALGEIVVELRGLDAPRSASLVSRFAPFCVPDRADSPSLVIEVRQDPGEYFVPPPASGGDNVVQLAVDGDGVRYAGHVVAGRFTTAVPGSGVLILRGGSYEGSTGAMENYIRAAVAWQAAVRGGALVHAASAVLDGQAYLFYGESGAGKSTLAASSRRGAFVSDDLSLVLPRPGGGLDLIGSPFRGTYEDGPRVQGRFPLVAGFRLVQAPDASVEDVPRVVALAELVGNLPFVAEGFGRRPELFERFETAFADVPLARLRFRKDDSYWDAIAAAEF